MNRTMEFDGEQVLVSAIWSRAFQIYLRVEAHNWWPRPWADAGIERRLEYWDRACRELGL